MQEENIPLIPKPVDAENHDIEHVLREVFHDVLEKPKYPKNIAKNLLKNNIHCVQMKDGAKNVENIVNYSLLSMEDIGIVEEKIMYRQGEYLLQNARKDANKSTTNAKLLKREGLMKPVERSDLMHYGLLEGGDLLPDIFRRSLDFTLNENEHRCNPCLTELDLFGKEIEIAGSKPVTKRRRSTRIRNIEQNEKCIQSPFQLSSDKIVFCNYSLNKTYKKQFRLRNVSKTVQVFGVYSFPTSENFTVDVQDNKNNNRIYPGLSVNFVVTFRTDNYMDIQDTLVINSTLESGDDDTRLTILLASYRDAPNLFIYVCKNVFPIKCSSTTFDISRSIALNNSIDCGACFLTGYLRTFLIVRNNGGRGKFFFMSEENWFDSNVNTLHRSLDLEIGNFIIFPAYFEILSDEYIQIFIEFRTKTKGLNLEKAVLLCNNATYEKLDLIADGILFDRYCISINEKNLLPLEHLAYILYEPKDELFQVDVGEDASDYDKDIDELKNMLEHNFASCDVITSSDAVTAMESEFKVKTASEAVLTYLKDTKQDIVVPGESDSREQFYYKYLLFFESAVPFQRNKKIITINNNCLVDLHYYWKVEDTGSEKLGYENLRDLDRNCLGLNLTPDIALPSYSTTDFDIVLIPNFLDEGFFRLALSLYIKGVPKCAIASCNFIIIKHPESDLVDVLIATFDVVCRIAPVVIEFFPAEILRCEPLCYNEVHEFTVFVNVSTELKDPMDCYWSIGNENIKIYPNEVQIRSDENIQFTLTLHNKSYDYINEEVVFNVNNIYKKALPIHVKVERPALRFQYAVLDLGWLQIGNKYGFKFFILNNNYVSVEWEIWEKYPEEMVVNDVEVTITNLEDRHIEVEYVIDAQEEVSWESELQIYTIFNGEKTLDSTCFLKYNTSKLSVLLHTPMSQCPILSPKQILYINTKYSYTLCLHNTSKISTYFFFGKPFGLKSDLLDLTIISSVGFLEAEKTSQVNVEIIPKSVGVIDEVYVPCYFKQCNCFLKGEEKESEVINLAVLYVAEDIFVNIKFPVDRRGVEEVVTWPPQMVYDFDYEFIDYEHLATVEQEDGEEGSKQSEKADVMIDDINLNDDISKYLNAIQYPLGEETVDEDSNLLVPNNSQASITLSSDSGVTQISQESLKCAFNDKEFMIQEHVIEIFDVPLRTLVRKSIEIENCTPIVGVVNVETVNFNPVSVYKKKIDELLDKMSLNKFDDFDKMLPEEGIWINAECDENELPPFEKITVELLIYANTWGTYAEELLIEINEVLPFCISILVDVTGLPLEFANFKNSLQKYPLLRFGTIPYKSDPVNRKIYFKNVSFVPLSITWHIFLKTKDRNDQPITLVFDIFHPNLELKLSEHDSMGNLMLMYGKYFGNTEQYIFNIEPKESFINAGDTKHLSISFDPRAYAAKFKQKKVEAYLIGYVQITQKFRYLPNMFLRKFGSQMSYLKMKLTATLELPILLLELVKGDLRFVFYASVVIDWNGEQTKTLCFKNFHTSDAAVKMSCEEPLVIESMETKSGVSLDGAVVVGPRQSVDVKICYKMESEFVRNIAETLYNINYDPNVYNELNIDTSSHKMTKYINIKQKGIIKQKIPVEIVTYFPYLDMTSELDFGFVFVGNNKKQILTIWNYTSCRVPFKLESTGDLILNPSIGIVDSVTPSGPSHIDISVIFIPRVYKAYLETILLTTNVPGCTRMASVRGIGTHDEKHFQYDQC